MCQFRGNHVLELFRKRVIQVENINDFKTNIINKLNAVKKK